MKKYFIILLILSIVIINSASALATSVDVYPSSITKTVGSTFTVDIKINNVTNLAGFDVKLSWKSNILELVSVIAKPNNLWINNIKMQEEKFTSNYSVAYVQQAPSPSFSGSATIATLTFKVKNAGSCILELTDTMLGNTDLDYIDHSTNNGYFTGVASSRMPKPLYTMPYMINTELILIVSSIVLIIILIVVVAFIINKKLKSFKKHTKK